MYSVFTVVPEHQRIKNSSGHLNVIVINRKMDTHTMIVSSEEVMWLAAILPECVKYEYNYVSCPQKAVSAVK